MNCLANRRTAAHEEVGVGNIGSRFAQYLQQRAGEHAAVVPVFPGFLDALAGGEQNMAAGRDLQRLAALPERGVITVQDSYIARSD